MTQDNPAADPNPDPSREPTRQPVPDPQGKKPAGPAPRKRRWVRRLAIVAGVLLLLVALLIALIPTIASTGAARSYVVKTVNERLNGKVEIADWSIGWTSGIKADGIRVFDEQNRQILEIPHVSTQLSLLGAARGQYHLGKTVVDGLDFNAERYPDGTLNFAKLMKQTKPAATSKTEKQAEEPAKTSTPSKLPDVDGDIQLVNCRGTVQTDAVDPKTGKQTSQMVKFTSIKGGVNIPNINQPITNSLEVVENTGGPDSGTVSVNGKLQIAKNNVLLPTDEMNVDQKLGIATFELASVLGFCPPNITALAGKSDGSVNIHLAAHEAAVIDALVQTKNFKLGGPILKGDTYVADAVTITVPKTTVDMSPGLGGSDNYRIRIGPAGGKEAITLALANTVRGKPSQSTATLTADVTPGQLKNIGANKAPGGDGMIHTGVDLDLAALAASVPHALGMQPNVRLDSGRLTEGTDVRIAANKALIQQALDVKDVAGTNTADNKQIALQPINVSIKATSLGGGGHIPDLRDILLVMTTGAGANGGYATANVTAPTLSNLDAKVHVVLEQFQKEFAQIIDFNGLNLAGTMDLAAASKGNLIPEEAKPGEKLTADANMHLTFANLKVEGMKDRSPLNEPRIELVTTGTLEGGKDQFVQRLSNINTTLDTNDPTGPTIDTHFAGSVDLKKGMTDGPGVLEIKRMDIARLKALASGTPTTPGANLTKGIAKGTVNFGTESQQVTVGGNLDITEITIAVPNATGLTNEQIKLTFAMRAPEDLSSATIPQMDIAGSMLTARLADAQVQLKEGSGADAKPVPTLQKLRKATITFDVPAVEKLQALLDSLSAPATSKPVAGSGTASADRFGALLALANPKDKQPDANAPAAPTPPTKLAHGSLKGMLNVTGDARQLVVQPNISGADLVLSKDGVPDPIGAVAFNGQMAIIPAPVPPAGAAPKTTPSIMDQIASIQFTNLAALGVGSGIKINGGIEDLAHARTMRNVTIDLTYNATQIWAAVRPLMAKESQESYKDVKIAGNYTRQITLGGSMPADKPFNEAVKTLTAKGEFLLDSFEHGGATLNGWVLPFNLSQGLVRIAYADKPEGQNFPAPAHLNGGNFVLGGAVVNLAEEHPRLNIPAGTKIMENVSLNPLFASTFLGDFLNNPMFVGANQASGLLNAIVNRCERLPIDSTVTQPIPSNDGVLDMTLTVQRIQIGNAMLANVAQQMGKVTGSGVNFASLQGDIPSFTVKIQHGVVTHDLTLAFGESKRPMHLFGDVALNTRQMHMTADFPWALFNMTPPRQLAAIMGDGVKVPLAGPVNAPQFNIVGLVQSNVQDNIKKNLTNPQDAADLLNNILGKDKKQQPNPPNNPNQPPQQQNKQDPLDLLNNLMNKNDKNKKGPPDSQPAQNR
ncbi:MAG: hypothetical protein JWN51_933 [Phycisphaerales bacterium]|nr:hypothetical protein [Phycisphaerales bacterium]